MAEQSGESEEREGIGEDRRPSFSDWLVARQDGSLYTRMVTHPGTNRARCGVTWLMLRRH